ncbi:MAG: protein kinase domain-containing protein [Myxococcota bacterium]
MATLATPQPSVPPANEDVRPGTVLADRYRIDALVGEGGAGRVYAAEHVLLRKKVAIKILRGDRANVPEMVQRFEREAMAAAHIEHPNIASAIDFGRIADGSVFLALEFVAGRSLRHVLRQGPLALGRSLRITRQIASALAGAQQLGIVHRDLKPENVMLIERGDDPDFVKVLDFGIARVPMANQAQPLTRVGAVFGTPAYMAPEQALGLPVDGRADLYALGVMLFEMLSGSRPFPEQQLGQQFLEPVPTLASRGVNVAPEIEAMVQTLLARDADQRFQRADALLTAIDAWFAQHGESGSFRAVANVVRQPEAGAPGRTATFMPGDPLPAFELTTHFPDALVPRPSVPVSAGVPRAEVPLASSPPQAKESAAGDALEASAPTVAVSPPHLDAKASWRFTVNKVRDELVKLWQRARARNAALLAESAVFLDVQRQKLPAGIKRRIEGVPSKTLVGAFLIGSSALLFVGILALIVRAGSSSEPNLPTSRSSAVASAEAPVAPPSAVPAAPVVAPVAADEESTLIELANSYTSEHRDAEAVALVQRVLMRQPELRKDARVGKVLTRTARSLDRAASDQSFALLEGSMGEFGAELIYDLSRDREASERVRRRADQWLRSGNFDRVSSTALYSAVKLRQARTCEQKHALLRLAADVGGRRTLEYLRELEGRTTCSAGQGECYACLAADSLLKQTIERIAERVGK